MRKNDINPELREKRGEFTQLFLTHFKRIRTALQSILTHHHIDKHLIDWITIDLAAFAAALSLADEPSAVGEVLKYQFAKETVEYDQEALKWLRYRQSQSKTIEEIIKRKDELARSIKEGKVDIHHLLDSAAKGDVDSLITILPHFDFDYQSRQPSLWERFIIFLLRRKVDTDPS